MITYPKVRHLKLSFPIASARHGFRYSANFPTGFMVFRGSAGYQSIRRKGQS